MNTEMIKEDLYDTLIRSGGVTRRADGHFERTDDPRIRYRAFVLPGDEIRTDAIEEAPIPYVTVEEAGKRYKGVIVVGQLRGPKTEPYGFILMYAGVEV